MHPLLGRIDLPAVLLTPVGLPAPRAHAAETLLSQGRPVVASSTEDPFGAPGAVDGNPATRWAGAFSDPQWIRVDLGAPARTNTGATFQFTYGRVEAHIKVPEGNGRWPAFCMLGADFLTGRPWPYNGEVDIMEVLGKDVKTAYSTVHAPAYNGGGSGSPSRMLVDYVHVYH